MRKIMYYAFMAMLSFTVAACKDETKDTKGPDVTIGEPEKGEEFTVGTASGIHIEFDLADESGIGQYKIDIHDAIGHTHDAISAVRTAAGAGVAWEYLKVYDDAAGLKNHHVHVHSDSIPADALLGNYHLAVRATDIHGNETYVATTFVLVDHEVEHDHDEDE
jgi:hypothetical protein